MSLKRPAIAAALLAATMAVPALAAPVELSSEAFVERMQDTGNGTQELVLTPAATVVPGERVRFVINYSNPSADDARDFVIVNPVPDGISFIDSDGDIPAEVSIGGTRFGSLADFTVSAAAGGERPARPADVTHIRWSFADPIPAGASGTVVYRGELR